jgi:hypothetical protein
MTSTCFVAAAFCEAKRHLLVFVCVCELVCAFVWACFCVCEQKGQFVYASKEAFVKGLRVVKQ